MIEAPGHSFWGAWCLLARGGWCDSPWGAEYWRVFDEWFRAGAPDDVRAFIIASANVPADRDQQLHQDDDQQLHQDDDQDGRGGA